jgi:hypothetical protein
MNKVKEELRIRLLSHLSSDDTRNNVNNAFHVCKRTSVSFLIFCAENYMYIRSIDKWKEKGEENFYSAEELFNKYIEL